MLDTYSGLRIEYNGTRACISAEIETVQCRNANNKANCFLVICKEKINDFPPSGGQNLQMPYTSARIVQLHGVITSNGYTVAVLVTSCRNLGGHVFRPAVLVDTSSEKGRELRKLIIYYCILAASFISEK